MSHHLDHHKVLHHVFELVVLRLDLDRDGNNLGRALEVAHQRGQFVLLGALCIVQKSLDHPVWRPKIVKCFRLVIVW